MLSVSTRFFQELELPNNGIRSAIAGQSMSTSRCPTTVQDACDEFFQQLRRKVYTTPKSYLDLISLYLSMLGEKRNDLKVRL